MNESEKAFAERMGTWEVHRKGWPDFLCVDGARTIAVEVKAGNDKLTKEQSEMLVILASLGIDCYVWHPVQGFDLYREGKRPERPRVPVAPQDKYTRVFSDRVMAEHARFRRGLTPVPALA